MNLQTSRFWGHLMTKKPKKTGGYDVGYGKPPEHTKWKKGQSGNPSGKKKKEADLLDTIKKIASEELIVHKHGVPHSVSYLEAAVYALFARAQSGHSQAFKLLADLLGKDTAESIAGSSYAMTEADLSVLRTSADWAAVIEQAEAELQAEVENGSNVEEGDHAVDP